MDGSSKERYYFEDSWMDSPETQDPALCEPACRVSARSLTTAAHTNPVILCVHGFSACTYEWEEFRSFAEKKQDVLVSNILMGAHGRSIYEFENSTWEQWGQPVLEEYRALALQGYTRINLLGSSTGGTIILYYLLAGALGMAPAPENVILIDPFIASYDKLFYATPLAKYFIGNLPNLNFSEEEKKHWYVNRPTSTFGELYKLVKKVKQYLKKKVRLSGDTRLRVYRSRGDRVAHYNGLRWLVRGIQEADGSPPVIREVDSNLHVFIRGQGRKKWTEQDSALQQATFAEILDLVLN